MINVHPSIQQARIDTPLGPKIFGLQLPETIFKNCVKLSNDVWERKDHISWNYGPSAWKEVLQIEADMRRRRKQEAYRKQEQIDNLINFAIGAVIFVLSGGILFVLFYFLGKWQGRW